MLCPNIFLVKTFSFIHKIYIYIYSIYSTEEFTWLCFSETFYGSLYYCQYQETSKIHLKKIHKSF